MAAIMFSSVVLPEPEGPISARNSPAAISIDTSSSAFTSKTSRLKTLADVARLHDFGLGCDICSGHCAHDCPLILILSPSFKFCGADGNNVFAAV